MFLLSALAKEGRRDSQGKQVSRSKDRRRSDHERRIQRHVPDWRRRYQADRAEFTTLHAIITSDRPLARAFFWEDVVSMLVIALHTAYLVVLINGSLAAEGQMLLALAAYAAYVVNALQFFFKLRAARRERETGPGELRPA